MNMKLLWHELRLIITILIGKILIVLCRFAKLGGTSFPGKVAEKLCPGILRELSSGLKLIMVTGTNGKTTTTRIIEKILQENKIQYITNKSGANLVNGVITAFIEAVDFLGKTDASIALIEIDEAAFSKICNLIVPHVLIVTNFFRDQLDRYGELYGTLKLVKKTAALFENIKLVLNADDSLCASIGKDLKNEVTYYGIDKDVKHSTSSNNEAYDSKDAVFCLYCQSKYEYDYHTYGHLGGFRCPNCGYARPSADISCTEIDEMKDTHTDIKMRVSNQVIKARVNLPGLYNIYNALAATACSEVLGLPIQNTVKAIGSFESGFGRMETIPADGKFLKLILVKNPTGFDQVLSYFIEQNDSNMQIAFIINDNAADGRDISWLWDVEFEKLLNISHKEPEFYVSGLRAEDMAVRLKYAGIDTNKITIIKDYEELVNKGLLRTQQSKSFYILPTYTAMLELRKLLKVKYNLHDFWE
ncbi:MAG TPA: DUF1727 domain-containing protein [Clostridiaceae bacterium]|nr:DUF1727 domain-containing protein [Clostridiaceae bacterium]